MNGVPRSAIEFMRKMISAAAPTEAILEFLKYKMTWPRRVAIAERWLPKPSILHPYPNLRFDAKHLRQEPHAAILHVRIRAGGGRQVNWRPYRDP